MDGTRRAFSIRRKNNELLAVGSEYKSRDAELEAIEAIKQGAVAASVEDHGAEGTAGHP